MQDLHEPSPEFTQFLEWQTRTELRRQDRFDRPSSTPRAGRVARIAALVLVSLLSGAGVVVAAERIQESRALEILLERNRVVLELSKRRVAAAVDAKEVARLRFEEGIVSSGELLTATVRVAELVRDRDHLQLDRVEMEAARRDVDMRLSAPLVGPRDFVSEHLRLDRVFVEIAAETRTAEEQRAQGLYDAGVITSSELARAKQAAKIAREDGSRLDARLAIRADFLLDRIDALLCENRDLVQDAEFRRARFLSEATHLDTQIERARQIEAAGLGYGEVSRLQTERDVIDVELQLIELELELLR